MEAFLTSIATRTNQNMALKVDKVPSILTRRQEEGNATLRKEIAILRQQRARF